MTIDEFLDELKKDKGKWRAMDSHCLRKQTKVEGADDYFCPITAVCYRKTRKAYPLISFQTAGSVLGLSWASARKIANTADIKGRSKLRKRLLEALKLDG